MVAPIDISLERIRRALFSFFGVKEADRPEILEEKIQKVGAKQVTNKAKDAWIEAGMPSPAGQWLANWNKEHSDG